MFVMLAYKRPSHGTFNVTQRVFDFVGWVSTTSETPFQLAFETDAMILEAREQACIRQEACRQRATRRYNFKEDGRCQKKKRRKEAYSQLGRTIQSQRSSRQQRISNKHAKQLLFRPPRSIQESLLIGSQSLYKKVCTKGMLLTDSKGLYKINTLNKLLRSTQEETPKVYTRDEDSSDL
ncbi:hypothetical protein CR513_41719, partial [Mucuna pruriens]